KYQFNWVFCKLFYSITESCSGSPVYHPVIKRQTECCHLFIGKTSVVDSRFINGATYAEDTGLRLVAHRRQMRDGVHAEIGDRECPFLHFHRGQFPIPCLTDQIFALVSDGKKGFLIGILYNRYKPFFANCNSKPEVFCIMIPSFIVLVVDVDLSLSVRV